MNAFFINVFHIKKYALSFRERMFLFRGMLRRCPAAHVAEVQGVLVRARALRAALADWYLIICRMADFRRLICRSHLVQGKCWRNAPDGGRHSPLECTAETSCALAKSSGDQWSRARSWTQGRAYRVSATQGTGRSERMNSS